MSKTALELKSFHNGLNSKTNSRDVLDDELIVCKNVSIDSVGRIVLSGSKSEITTTALTLATLKDSYGLFRFSSDFDENGDNKEQDYIITFDDAEGKLYWLPSSQTNWETISSVFDLSSEWGTSENASPVFYYVDGALRISDGNYSTENSRTINPPQWIGAINRTLFPDAQADSAAVISGWKRQKQQLLSPDEGTISLATAAPPSTGVHWQVRNLIPEDQLYNFSDAQGFPGVASSGSNNNLYTHTEQISSSDGASNGNITDEHWLTSYKLTDGYGGSNYHAFGLAMHGEDDDSGDSFTWTTINDFNQSNVKSFGTGQSIYVAIRMAGDEQKSFWDGTHAKAFSGESSLSLTIADAYIKFKESSGSDYIEFRIDHTRFTDISTPSGQWHIVEFPYDDAYDTSISGTFNPQKIELKLDLTWTRVNSIYSDSTSTGSPSPLSKYRDMKGFELLQMSDMRVGDNDLIGVTTVGKQKFLMSYTYDETNNESLLYDFGSTDSNELGNVVLENSTSAYKIGITSRISKTRDNDRITGANLYIEDDGIPYRIAQLKYMKGLKGAWESEYPTSNRFTRDASSPNNYTSGTIKTDGLPLLESYEALNGFSPNVSTNIAHYKTATVLNRRVYVANIYQDGKHFSDKMIKSNAASFDVMPSEGKSIDVVNNDGDSIVKLESYADRILQFKKNVVYLINATRDSEFLEDTFVGKGIVSQSASTKTDIGIAWANENGSYLYNGQEVKSLTDGKIDEDDWKAHVNESTDVTYHPFKKKIIVTGGSNGKDMYEYCFYTKSWTVSTDKFHEVKTNFVLDIDNQIKYIGNDSKLYKWEEVPSSTDNFQIITKDFTFGNPATRKKCFKFYVTYKADGLNVPSNVKVFYGVNGEDLEGLSKGTEVSTSSNYSGTTTNCYDNRGLISTNGVWRQAELIPPSSINNVYSVQLHFKSDGNTVSSFEINDVTIVYREKPLK